MKNEETVVRIQAIALLCMVALGCGRAPSSSTQQQAIPQDTRQSTANDPFQHLVLPTVKDLIGYWKWEDRPELPLVEIRQSYMDAEGSPSLFVNCDRYSNSRHFNPATQIPVWEQSADGPHSPEFGILLGEFSRQYDRRYQAYDTGCSPFEDTFITQMYTLRHQKPEVCTGTRIDPARPGVLLFVRLESCYNRARVSEVLDELTRVAPDNLAAELEKERIRARPLLHKPEDSWAGKWIAKNEEVRKQSKFSRFEIVPEESTDAKNSVYFYLFIPGTFFGRFPLRSKFDSNGQHSFHFKGQILLEGVGAKPDVGPEDQWDITPFDEKEPDGRWLISRVEGPGEEPTLRVELWRVSLSGRIHLTRDFVRKPPEIKSNR